ncbi:MAG TPA: aldose 1-epimerase [Vicinamibacterales bacterium]|nr:aldose 1-epimerase [Vicinamibacterales bacterium]
MNQVVLRPRERTQHGRPEFVEATLAPERGLRLIQARGHLRNGTSVDLLADSLSFAGAILLPFANRIRGQLEPDGRTIQTNVLGRRVCLPANWHGQRPGAETCAMHGLMFDTPMRVAELGPDYVVATLDAGNFDGHWPSRTFVQVTATLHATSLDLSVTAQNTGREPLPMGIGWHPYFAIPSGNRASARLHLPAAGRACVTNYDDVFPTGDVVDVAGTPYDFTASDGAALGATHFDDMFVDLEKTSAGCTQIEVDDASADYRMRLTALSREVTAVQLYAPPAQPFVVIEPQFNWADPFSDIWPSDVNTGMVVLPPDADTTWNVRWELL